MKGRSAELRTLERTIVGARPTRIALVGSGGSGKSMLAAALGYRLSAAFGGRIDWFRSGAWGFHTLSEMLALRFGLGLGDGRVERLRRFLARGPQRLIVLDNHEDDEALERMFEAFPETRATFVITARRCLLSGVLIFPVIAPLVTSGRSAFPRVAALTRLLRWNPLALDIADSIVASRAVSVKALRDFLLDAGLARVHALEHEDDLPEIALLVDWAWRRLGAEARRTLGVLAHLEGDHADAASLAKLARVARLGPALADLERWHLVQQPLRERYALHAVVRHAVARRTKPAPERAFAHYVALLERHPERLEIEQSHLFAAMEHAYRKSDMNALLRVNALAVRLERVSEERRVPAERKAAAYATRHWAAPETSWGHQSLQNTWSTDDMRGIPVDRRPQALGTQEFLSEPESLERARPQWRAGVRARRRGGEGATPPDSAPRIDGRDLRRHARGSPGLRRQQGRVAR